MSGLEDEVERIDTNVNGLFAQISQMKDRIADLEEQLEEERTERELLENQVQMAVGTARAADQGARADGSGPSQQEKARWLSRDAVIKRTVEASGTGPRNVHGERAIQIGSVTNRDVQQMGEPEWDLKWKTVDRAWNDLVKRWDAFVVDDSGDEKRLTLHSVDEVEDALAQVVEESVDEEGLADSVVGLRS